MTQPTTTIAGRGSAGSVRPAADGHGVASVPVAGDGANSDPARLPLPMVGVGGTGARTGDPRGSDASRDFYEGLSIGFLVSFAFRAMLDQHHTLLGKFGVRDFRAAHGYILLAVQGEGITLTDLVAQTQISKQALSQLVRELDERGLVKRTPDADDKRRLRIRLTTEGQALLSAAVSCWEEIEAGLAALVGEDALESLRETFVTYLSVYSPVEEGRRPKPRPIW